MTSFSGLGIGLSFLFGCMVMGFAAELYYLFYVRKRISNSLTKIGTRQVATNSRIAEINDQTQDLELGGTNNDLESSSLSTSIKLEGYREDSAELELMRLHNFRFLSTIKEETKEDLESDDGKSRGDRSRKCSKSGSFSDLTLVLTPLSSPSVKIHNCFDSCNSQEFSFNPLFESEIKSVKSSPPPKFKFLRDAEEKLIRRLIEEAAKRNFKDKVVSTCDETTCKSQVRALEIGTCV